MQLRFTFLSRFLVKFLEVAGAGLASAICAYALGQMGSASAPPISLVSSASQVSAVSQPAPASPATPSTAVASAVNETVAVAPREDRAEPARSDEAQKKPDNVMVARTPAPAPKLVRQPVQSHRPQKPEQPAVVEAKPVEAKPIDPKPIEANKPRVVERQPMMPPPSAAADVATKPAAPQSVDAGREAAGAKREEGKPLFARLRLVPPWFSSSTEKTNERPDERVNERPANNDVPRPPMPVGEPRGLM